ncbi:hypothetical protein DZC72_04230 [Maribacter algicola]|uniref:Uracil-DNA glycosylase-like domain-containing protein n=1 Tax=Maribacter algicola TaxID=2498892 RepID=A0A3R8S1A9_9FLAO|nr:hypothetical protein [Maribacter algicola]RRQ49805.1 hypothetical protein DZC72_04230 [Maribacter algicola]
MNIPKINSSLLKNYEAYLNHIRSNYPKEISSELSLPLFIHVNEEYRSLNKKIVVVGQETQTWYGKLDDQSFTAKNIIYKYEEFNFGGNRKYSPFWKFAHQLYGEFNTGKSIKGLLYTNLSRFDYKGKKVPSKISEKYTDGYGLLKKEIEITQPEIVVFTTCWNRDKYIKLGFPDADFREVSKFKPKFLARILHDDLPHNTFRTYHPKYLNYQNEPHNIKGIITGILNNIE